MADSVEAGEVFVYYNPVLKKEFSPPSGEGQYYNLGTGRSVTKTAANLKKLEFIEDPRVAGTTAQVDAFYNQEAEPIAEGTLEAKVEPKETKVWIPTTTNIADVPLEELLKLCDFNYRGLQVPARVTRVIDGDTFDVAFYMPAEFISQSRKLTSRGSPVRNGITFPETKGYFQLVNCRFDGVDAFEHDTGPGREATRWLEFKLDEVQNLVYVHFRAYEKYGRSLVTLYLDKEMTKNLNQMMLDYTHPILGKIAEPYDGGAKSDFAKTLTRTKKPKGMSKEEYNLPVKVAVEDKPGLGSCEVKMADAAAVGAIDVVATMEAAQDHEVALLEQDTVRYAPGEAPIVSYI